MSQVLCRINTYFFTIYFLIILSLTFGGIGTVVNAQEKKGSGNAGTSPSYLFRKLVDMGVPYVVVAPSAFINDVEKRGGFGMDDDYDSTGFMPEGMGEAIKRLQAKGFLRTFGAEGPYGISGSRMDKRYGYSKRLRDRYRMAFGLGRRKKRELNFRHSKSAGDVIQETRVRRFARGKTDNKMPFHLYLNTEIHKEKGSNLRRPSLTNPGESDIFKNKKFVPRDDLDMFIGYG